MNKTLLHYLALVQHNIFQMALICVEDSHRLSESPVHCCARSDTARSSTYLSGEVGLRGHLL